MARVLHGECGPFICYLLLPQFFMLSPIPSSSAISTHDDLQLQRQFDAAVHRLLDSFSQIPARWVQELAHFKHNYLPFPMWGTLFMPLDHIDVDGIQRLFKTIECDDDGDLQELRDAGWHAVGDTGILAIYFEDELLLGINGAGYDFYEAHWAPLYQALGYHWHL